MLNNTIYFILLFTAALLFSLQFLFTKIYQKYNGSSLASSFSLLALAYITIAVFFFIKAKIELKGASIGFSWFTIGISILIALVTICCISVSVKVLKIGNMSVYSVFMTVGSIVLSSLAGIIFYKESISFLKVFALLLMVGAVATTLDLKNGSNKKAVLYYILVFFLNGLVGVLFTIHQNNPTLTACYSYVEGVAIANSDVFMSYYGIVTAVISFISFLVYKAIIKKNNIEQVEELPEINRKSLKFILMCIGVGIGYGLFNGLGNYFIAISTTPNAVGSSVSFPIANGGLILFSFLIDITINKEQIKLKNLLGAILVIVSTILFMFI